MREARRTRDFQQTLLGPKFHAVSMVEGPEP